MIRRKMIVEKLWKRDDEADFSSRKTGSYQLSIPRKLRRECGLRHRKIDFVVGKKQVRFIETRSRDHDLYIQTERERTNINRMQ